MTYNTTTPSVDTLSVSDAIKTRRSVRKYTDQIVPQADITEILELAGRAPSAWNIQPWRFVVITNPDVKEQLKAAAYGQGQVTSAPAVIIAYSDMQDSLSREKLEATLHPGVPAANREGSINGILGAFASKTEAEKEEWGVGQSYIAIGYLSLAARSLGYDTTLMLGFDPAKVKEILNLPENVRIPAMITLGVAAEEGFPTHRLDVESLTTWVK